MGRGERGANLGAGREGREVPGIGYLPLLRRFCIAWVAKGGTKAGNRDLHMISTVPLNPVVFV